MGKSFASQEGKAIAKQRDDFKEGRPITHKKSFRKKKQQQ